MESLLLVSQINCPDPISLRGENYVLDDGPIIKVRLRKSNGLWDKLMIFCGFTAEYEVVSGFRVFLLHKKAGYIRVPVTITED